MKDAGIEAKRDHPAFTVGRTLSANLGKLEAVVDETLAQAAADQVIQRIWQKDATLWKSDADHVKIIKNSLGWLAVPEAMLKVTGELETFAKGISLAGFRHVMVCGMGGSSLCPEVLRRTFGVQEGFPELLVLDSTDPDAIKNFARQIDVIRCLFVIASKSGTTTEPNAFHKYWYYAVGKISSTPGDHFVAITDPATQMVATATAENFRHIFLNQPDIGGRYSALSYFGMAPAALMGLQPVRILQNAQAMAQSCRETDPIKNAAAILGAIMADCAIAGRDKLTLVTDKKVSSLGLWVEQLVAESTGKEGKGIIPIVAEPLGEPSVYGNDRLFVSIVVGELDQTANEKLQKLADAGHPVVYLAMPDAYDLGSQFFLWEMATAFAGWRLGINPFDQPNVQESKDATKALLDQFKRKGKLSESTPSASEGALSLYAGAQGEARSVDEVLKEHLAKVRTGDYVAVLAYVEETNDIDADLGNLRLLLRDLTGCATTVGYGPRFLHSTGQLHKGGPDNGVFFQLTAGDGVDFEVPAEPYTFSILKQAQAQGDFQSLLAHGRRALRIDLGKGALDGLQELISRLEKICKEGR